MESAGSYSAGCIAEPIKMLQFGSLATFTTVGTLVAMTYSGILIQLRPSQGQFNVKNVFDWSAIFGTRLKGH